MFSLFEHFTKMNQRIWVSLVLTIFFIALDLLTKFIATRILFSGELVVIIPHFIDFVLVKNTGISFGWLGHGGNPLGWYGLSLFTLLAILYLLWVIGTNFYKLSNLSLFCCSLIIGGAVSNAWERMYLSYVTDFIHFHFFSYSFFVNNMADNFISLGAFLLALEYLIKKKKKDAAQQSVLELFFRSQ